MPDPADQPEFFQIFSIGHSNGSVEDFLDLLGQHGIEVLVDVRSHPYSKFATQFDGPALKTAVVQSGRKYLYLGRELGGRPADRSLYDETGRVKYGEVAATPLFQAGIARLLKGLEKYRVAFMCTEEDPTGCHRHLLVSRVLAGHGIMVGHIRGDGRVQGETELKGQHTATDPAQLALFADEDYAEWKSLRPALPKKVPPNSLKP